MNIGTFVLSVAAAILAVSLAVLVYLIQPVGASQQATAAQPPTSTAAIQTTTREVPSTLQIRQITLYVIGAGLWGGRWNYTYVVEASAPSGMDAGALRAEVSDFALSGATLVSNRTYLENSTAVIVLVFLSRSQLNGTLAYAGRQYKPDQVFYASRVGLISVTAGLQSRNFQPNYSLPNAPILFPDRPIEIPVGWIEPGTYRVSVSPDSVSVEPKTVNVTAAARLRIQLPNTPLDVNSINITLTRAG